MAHCEVGVQFVQPSGMVATYSLRRHVLSYLMKRASVQGTVVTAGAQTGSSHGVQSSMKPPRKLQSPCCPAGFSTHPPVCPVAGSITAGRQRGLCFTMFNPVNAQPMATTGLPLVARHLRESDPAQPPGDNWVERERAK